MQERGLSVKEALNEAIRAGVPGRASRRSFRTRTSAMGPPRMPPDKAMRLAAELEDEELIRKLAARKWAGEQMRLVDANVLLYAVNKGSAHHRRSRAWLDGALNGQETVGFAWVPLLAFLRLATHAAVFQRPLSVNDASDTLRRWLAQPPAIVVEATSRHAGVLAGRLAEAGTAGNLVSDAHLAALAIEHDAVLVSFDADFGRFPGLRWETPAA